MKMENNKEIGDYKMLSQIKRQEPFEAPEGYYEQFNTRLRDRINTNSHQPASLLRPALLFTAVLGAAAVIFFLTRTSVNPETLPEPEYADLIESGYFYQMDEEQISEAYVDMFHESPSADMDTYLLQQLDEETLTSNL
jgi:hypothetical protein